MRRAPVVDSYLYRARLQGDDHGLGGGHFVTAAAELVGKRLVLKLRQDSTDGCLGLLLFQRLEVHGRGFGLLLDFSLNFGNLLDDLGLDNRRKRRQLLLGLLHVCDADTIAVFPLTTSIPPARSVRAKPACFT